MSKNEEFSFDSLDTGFEDIGQSDNDMSDSFDKDFDTGINSDFDNFDNEAGGDKKSLVKTAVIMVVVGIVIIAGGIVLSKILGAAANSMGKEKQVVNQIEVNTPQNNTGVNNNQTADNNGWISFNNTDGDIEISSEMTTTFTITSINHFVKITDGTGNNIAVKTIVTGNISGFIGTYEMELPYDKGIKVKNGMTFTVTVNYGEYNGKVVIGSIKY